MKQLSLVFIILFIIFSLNLNSSITHIWPSSGTNDTTRAVHIFGDGFNGGISELALSKSGYPNVYATNISVINDNYLTCDFNLSEVSATIYNLIINSDTLDMCFTVNYLFNYSQTFWSKTYLGSGGNWMTGITVGDGNNDGIIEVYGTCDDYHLYQYSWNGSLWEKTDLGSGGSLMFGLEIKDGNNDGLLEVYGACNDYHIYQFTWNGSSWIKTEIANLSSCQIWDITVGDGNCDGEIEVYVTVYQNNSDDYHIYQFKWNGSNWDMVDLGYAGHWDELHGVVVGDGNNNGEFEVYVSSFWSEMYQFKFYNNTWNIYSLGFFGEGMHGVTMGDGNNDGDNEIYVGLNHRSICQFKYYQNNWEIIELEYSGNGTFDVSVGDGNNNGFLEVYGASYNIYQYQLKPKYISDTILNLLTFPGDSTIRQFYIKNVSYQDLIIDSMILPMPEYFLINLYLPDTIAPDDSVAIDIMFKPESIGYFACSLQIFLCDSLFPQWFVYLEGWADSTYPSTVNLISPENGGSFNNSFVNFFWYTSYDSFPGIDYYKLQWALDHDFTINLHEYIINDTFIQIRNFPDTVYYWRVKAYDLGGLCSPWSDVWSFTVDHLGIEEEVNITNGFKFSFASFSRERTVFRFSIPELSNISLKIYDISGREVSELISGQYQPGFHEIPFNPERSGVYFYQLESKFLNKTGKFTILR